MFLAAKALDFSPREIISGNFAPEELAKKLSLHHASRPFVLIDPFIEKSGMAEPIISSLTSEGMKVVTYSDIVPNPTVESVEKASDKYVAFLCDCLIAIGGGSTIDTAKAVAIKVAYPNKKLSDFKGVLKVHRKLPPLIAIPTTAGTGSEVTLATVVVDSKKKDKFAIEDPKLIPSTAVFYPKLLSELPPSLIASTGMDAFTHAIESYIGKSNVKQTKEDALKAMVLIHRYLLKFQSESKNEAYALDMLEASYLAGRAFTRAYVGYVHALAHALGGEYNVGHGYANAILLPYVLRAYGKSIETKLAEISDCLELVPKSYKKAEKARNFLAYLDNLLLKLGLPDSFDGLIKEEDVSKLAIHAAKEGNPLYPVPKEMGARELAEILRKADKSLRRPK